MPTIDSLLGRNIINYQPGTPLQTMGNAVYRVGFLDYDDYEDNWNFIDRLDNFFENDDIEKLDALIIGAWSYEDISSVETVQKLVENAGRLQNIKTLFFGDISYDEQEISWIENSDMGPLLDALPNLTYFRVRGGMGLEFNTKGHKNLQTLIVETGGLARETTEQIINMELPELVDLELWFGSDYYGFEGDLELIKPLIIGKPYPDNSYPFPKLTRLGLRNCQIADELAEAFMDARALDQLKELDFSMGTMTTRGAEALANNDRIANLESLNLDSNCIQDAALVERLSALGPQVIIGGQKSADDLYVDVGE
jgi:hypothetical protein